MEGWVLLILHSFFFKKKDTWGDDCDRFEAREHRCSSAGFTSVSLAC